MICDKATFFKYRFFSLFHHIYTSDISIKFMGENA